MSSYVIKGARTYRLGIVILENITNTVQSRKQSRTHGEDTKNF